MVEGHIFKLYSYMFTDCENKLFQDMNLDFKNMNMCPQLKKSGTF